MSQPGIFKPAILPEVPLTIRTAPEEERRVRAYADEMDSEGRLRYRYRGTDPPIPTTLDFAVPCSAGSRSSTCLA